MTSQKSRSYCFTINNYTDEDIDQATKLKYSYIILGDERGETNETPHIQGYVYFQNPISFKSIKKNLPRAHIEICKGSSSSNINYCKKENNILFEDGEQPKQGNRSDLHDIRDAIIRNEPMRDIITNYSANYQAVKYAETIRKYIEPKRDFKPIVKWYYGETGTGKTFRAYQELGVDAYYQNGTKWWDGYDAHEGVIIDDFRCHQMPFNQLLKLLDRYPYIIEHKGGSRQFLAKNIIITSPLHPSESFSTNENIEQLIRRIDIIEEIKKTI